MNPYPDRPGAIARFFRVLIYCASAFLVLQLISIYLSWPQQLILGSISILLGLVVNRLSTSRVITLALMLISMTATLRYGWWRVHLLIEYFSDESNNRLSIDTVFLLLLISAEAYTVMIMFLGYMQTAWPLERKPLPMPADVSKWPHVDVLIPTYNEPLSLVRYTALAALNIDYPQDKLHIYILDDGTREDFQEFSRVADIGYITREEHSHAKAGNINHALTMMKSPYVAIFDCDHVPTRSFLQMTLGWMLADPKLGMLQTPHHFYSHDPFERNLQQYKTIPNEAELFYGIVQDGNDFWNATFFCGSCAVLSRAILDEVGGIATETVTEDAHTSLRMQKRGYNTAYINIPQAAGLATETLSAHVGQRIRWARGMIQILRTDNPLFAWKMKFTQRLCYFNAMAHFLYAVPRLVFLGAPLVYLLLGRTIIPGYWVAIVVYALPHLILASLTNSRIQGRHRHSFWNEIYESVLAPYILAPTLLAFINPKLGKFNVTGKGSTLSTTRFDSRIAAPTKWILFLNFLGLVAVPYRILVTDRDHIGAVVMNLIWVLFNMVILGVAAAVAYEQKQRRASVRIEARIPVRIDLPGRQIGGMSLDMSVGGASIEIYQAAEFAIGDTFKLAFPENAGGDEIDATVIGVRDRELRLVFSLPTIGQQETLTRALYSRADAWISSLAGKEVDRPLVSLGRVIRLSVYGIYQVLRSLLPEKPVAVEASSASTAVLILLAFALGGSSRALGARQAAGAPNAGNPAVSQQMRNPPGSPSAAAANPVTGAAGAALTSSSPETNGGILQAMSLKDMGLLNDIEMRGPHSYYSVHFTLSHMMVPQSATLRLIYTIGPGLDPHTASLAIMLNGIAVGTLPSMAATDARDGFSVFEVSIPNTLLVRSNTLTFEFKGSGVMESEEQVRQHVYIHISPVSSLQVMGDRLVMGNNLNQLPLPIFDSGLQTTTTVPFVFLSQPSAKALEAAGIVASWLGLNASSKPVRFAASIGQIPPGYAVVFSDNPTLLPASLQISPGSGPLLALRTNPSDAYGNVLVLSGQDDDQLLTVARTLSLATRTGQTITAAGLTLSGDTAHIPDLPAPKARVRDDAPLWLPISRDAPLASCQIQDTLVSDGSSSIPIYFHISPNLSYGEEQNIDMHLHYRYNALPVAPGSALRVFVNGVLINEIPLLPGKGSVEGLRTIMVPVASLRPFGNTILFNYDFIAASPQTAQGAATEALSGQILCNSSLDLHGLALWTDMPNLELFANAGFPFTRLADLSQTSVILPEVPSTDEIALYLHLMGHFGEQTGYPVLQVTVDGPNTVISKARDYLILGTLANQPAFKSLDPLLPVTFDSTGVHVKPEHGYLAYLDGVKTSASQWISKMLGRPFAPATTPSSTGVPDAMVEEIKSPASPDRSIVLVELRQDSSADDFAGVFLERSQSTDILGSVSLLDHAAFGSYALGGSTYHVGDITWYSVMRIWLARHYLLLLLVVTALSLLAAFWAYQWLSWHAHERLKLAETKDAAV
jgi:cellulose synthase (UDP-forming)